MKKGMVINYYTVPSHWNRLNVLQERRKKPKTVKTEDEEKMEMIQGIHCKYYHASHNELERLFYCAPKEFVGITLQDLKKWKEMSTRCIEGTMKESMKLI
jgi:hypothetical protein